MGVVETITVEIAKRVLDRVNKTKGTARTDSIRWSKQNLRQHLIEITNWTARIDFFGLSAAKSTDSDTVGLLNSLPRKFTRGGKASTSQSEERLLHGSKNLVLLGDPGAGKTTTIKRLVRRILLQPPKHPSDHSQYPLLVRLRDISPAALLEEILADALKLPHQRRRKQKQTSDASDKNQGITEGTDADEEGDIQGTVVTIHKKSALDVIVDIVNGTDALVFFDGLDEVRPDLRQRTEETIVKLAEKSDRARYILSCRSGDYTRTISYFDIIEICPLNDAQIKSIITKWSSQPAALSAAISRLPFADLATRPLFLCELIVLYEKLGYLPSQPAAIYRRIITLALEEWDLKKPVKRQSQYSNFDPDRKLDFLANLAYCLTFKIVKKAFNRADLAEVYEEIRENFTLPQGEVGQVIKELETHTGILIEAGYEQWEFSHLSIQEYLAAHYMVRDQITSDVTRYMRTSPAALAISVAIAAHPTRRLAGIILQHNSATNLTVHDVSAFFARLLQERPAFKKDLVLGYVAVALVFQEFDAGASIKLFLREDVVSESLSMALQSYDVQVLVQHANACRLRLGTSVHAVPELLLPKSVEWPLEKLESLLDELGLSLHPAQEDIVPQLAGEKTGWFRIASA